MKIRIKELYESGLWVSYCEIKGWDPANEDYLEQRWLDLITVPPSLEDAILNIRPETGQDIL